MYKIERKTSGYLLIFRGDLDLETTKEWYAECRKILVEDERDSFGVIVDWRDFGIIKPKAQPLMKEAQEYWRDHGMERSAVIIDDPIKKLNLSRVARQSGHYEWERFIDCTHDENWFETAKKWVVEGIDPDKDKN